MENLKMNLSRRMRDPFNPDKFGGAQFDHSAPVISPGARPEIVFTPKVERDGDGKRISGCFACGSQYYVTGEIHEIPVGPYLPRRINSASPLTIEVHTLRYGNPEWMKVCAPSLDAWCLKHGYAMKIHGKPSGLPDEKFDTVRMMREFMEGESEMMLFIDADVLVLPSAPAWPDLPGFASRPEKLEKTLNRWKEWAGEKGLEVQGWAYRNSGVWSCDRAAAEMFLSETAGEWRVGYREQHQFNEWWMSAHAKGMRVSELGLEWNSLRGVDVGPAWFHHFAGRKKEKKIFDARSKGLVPDEIKRVNKLMSLVDYGSGAVVWPWASEKADWNELWYSYHSVKKHWNEKSWKHVLLGDVKPEWWEGEFIECARYEDALWVGTQCAEQVLWMNDDIFLIGDQGVADYQTARYMEDMEPKLGRTLVAKFTWRRGLGQVLMRCHLHGRGVLNFSTHTPYLYERAKVPEVHREFGIFYKIPFETAYHNWHRTPAALCVEKAKSPEDLKDKLWINPAMRQVTPRFETEMSLRFGRPPGGEWLN